jgi:hypothetical protein
MGTSKAKGRYYIPTHRKPANTGPKGVIADAQAFQQAKRIHMSTLRLGNGNSNPAATPLMVQTEESAKSWLADGEDPSSDDSNDEFLSRWRQSRLRELTSNRGRVNNPMGSRDQRNAPPSGRYGTLTTVDAVGYLNAIEQTPSDTVVLVFIYDDTVSSSDYPPSTLSLTSHHCSPKYPPSQSSPSLTSPLPALMHDSSSYTTSKPKWNPPVSLPFWHIAPATSLLAWYPCLMKSQKMKI